jgi:hypothetical protein
MAVQTSTTIVIDVTYRVTVDLDDLCAYEGINAPITGYEETSLVNHVRNVIEHRGLIDSPAAFDYVAFTGQVE